MEIYKASTYGFCKGVENALNIVNMAKVKPIHLIGDLIHNSYVNEDLKNKGVIIHDIDNIKEIEEINNGTIIFSSHGHNEDLDALVKKKNLPILDATCPYIKRNIKNIKEDLKNNIPIIFIGIPFHQECKTILSLSNEIILISYKNPIYPRIYLKNPHVYIQTTLAFDEVAKICLDIKNIYDNPIFIDGICKATQTRQVALNEVPKTCPLIFIIGDKNSSNCQRLYEICLNKYHDKKTYFVSDVEEVKKLDLKNYKSCFISAGASTPNIIIEEIINHLMNL